MTVKESCRNWKLIFNGTLRILLLGSACFSFGSRLGQVQSVEGVVVNAVGEPMQNAEVSLFESSPNSLLGSLPKALKTVVVDSAGRFRIDVAKAGRYRLVPALSGFVYLPAPWIKTFREPGIWIYVGVGEEVSGVEVSMQREGVITGMVLDVKGSPIPTMLHVLSLLQWTFDELGRRQLSPLPGTKGVVPNDRGEFAFSASSQVTIAC